MAGGDRANDVFQIALLVPTCGQFLLLQPRSFPSYDISGTMQEELTQCLSRPLIERGRFERRPHMLQPSGTLGGSNPETRVRFAQAQPPSVLGLVFIAAQELNEESGEFFSRAPEALAWEQRTQNRVLDYSRVKFH